MCITSETVHDEVKDLAGYDTVWIGFNDGQDEGEWVWNRDSCASTYDGSTGFWDADEPNNDCGSEVI